VKIRIEISTNQKKKNLEKNYSRDLFSWFTFATAKSYLLWPSYLYLIGTLMRKRERDAGRYMLYRWYIPVGKIAKKRLKESVFIYFGTQNTALLRPLFRRFCPLGYIANDALL